MIRGEMPKKIVLAIWSVGNGKYNSTGVYLGEDAQEVIQQDLNPENANSIKEFRSTTEFDEWLVSNFSADNFVSTSFLFYQYPKSRRRYQVREYRRHVESHNLI
jgi:hypothetical protein